MTVEARVNATVTVNGGNSAAELDRLANGMGRVDLQQRRVANSANQVRAATTNLGQQLNDIAQGFAAGINPATIFAQQSGQVAFALQGMNGALGKVGAFLGGPWGIALSTALIALSPFVGKLFEGETAAKRKKAADDDLAKALGELDRATGLANKSAAEGIRLAELSTAAAIEEAKKKRDVAKATLDAAEARLAAARADQSAGGARGANFGSFGVTATAEGDVERARKAFETLRKEIAGAEAASARSAAFGRADLRSRAAVDPAERVRQEADAKITAIKKLNLTEEEYARRLTAVRAEEKAALAAITEARKADTQAAREATREARAYADQIERLSAVSGQTAALVRSLNARSGGIGNLAQQAEAESDRARQESGLAAIVANIDSQRDAARAIGKSAADGFRDGAIADAAAIGNAIGGGLGRAISGIAALGLGTRGANGVTTDFTGVGKQLTSLIQPLTNAFGDGGRRFAANIGKAAGGAATGSVISGIGDALGIKNSKTGAQIGGAIGSFIPIPGGEIIGSILGGLFGGLFGSRPKGSTTISSTGGSISQSSTGDKAIARATGVIGNSISDALTSIAQQLGADIGTFSVSIGKDGDRFRVDTAGRGRTKKNNRDVIGFDTDEGAAIAFAIADALKDGAIVTSPRVQAALTRYGDNVNRAVAEALKVKGLEDLLADRNNPFTSVFRTLEQQLKQRVQVAKENGFDLVEIERINGEDRAAALRDTLANATGSIRTLLNDLQFGSRATGSPTERLAGLISERDRLTALARGGDTSQLDAIASIIQQIDDLQKETFGKTQGFASGRADSVALLNDLVKTTEDRIKAAADQARAATETTNNKLTEANATLEDIYRANLQTNQSLVGLTAAMQTVVAGRTLAGGNVNSQFVRMK